MKTILYLVILIVMVATGCASSQYSESSYQDRQVLQDYIRDHPEFYEKMQEERP